MEKSIQIKTMPKCILMDFKKVTVGFFAAVMAMTSVCFADPETPVTTDVPATDPVPETTTTCLLYTSRCV